MFRTCEEHHTPWEERMLPALRAQRFESAIRALPPLREQSFEQMSLRDLTARIEGCWQDIPRKPLRAQQAQVAREAVLRGLYRQADCLSPEEHALCERMLIHGGAVWIGSAQEMDAARALSLRLLAHVGMHEGKPAVRLDAQFAPEIEKAFSRREHARMRMRLFSFQATVCAALYLAGVLDDQAPQRLFTAQVLGEEEPGEEALQLARHYLWAGFDCVDYEGGVLLVHPAVTEPEKMARENGAQLSEFGARELLGGMQGILPQEQPGEEALIRAIEGALRPGLEAGECAKNIRLLCKQDAPVEAVEEALDSMLLVRCTERMRAALHALYDGVVRWSGTRERVCGVLQ